MWHFCRVRVANTGWLGRRWLLSGHQQKIRARGTHELAKFTSYSTSQRPFVSACMVHFSRTSDLARKVLDMKFGGSICFVSLHLSNISGSIPCLQRPLILHYRNHGFLPRLLSTLKRTGTCSCLLCQKGLSLPLTASTGSRSVSPNTEAIANNSVFWLSAAGNYWSIPRSWPRAINDNLYTWEETALTALIACVL